MKLVRFGCLFLCMGAPLLSKKSDHTLGQIETTDKFSAEKQEPPQNVSTVNSGEPLDDTLPALQLPPEDRSYPYKFRSGCKPKKPKFTWSGCVQPSIHYDKRVGYTSRETSSYRQPRECLPDCRGRDINKRGEWDVLAIETALRLTARGPRIYGAKIEGVIDGDFEGISDFTTELFRLRQGFVQLSWKVPTHTCGIHSDFIPAHKSNEQSAFSMDKSVTEFITLLGMTWHPLYPLEASPHVIADNSGQPFDPFNRIPQIRLTIKYRNIELLFAGSTELHPPSDGPLGFTTFYERWSKMPEWSQGIRWYYGPHLVGSVVNVKRIVPRIFNDAQCRVDESLISVCACVYNHMIFHDYYWNLKSLFVQNGTHISMLGGYAVQTISQLDKGGDIRTYTPLNTFSIWTEFGKEKGLYRAGIFIGYTKNLGSSSKLAPGPNGQPILYGELTNTDAVYRVSPRFVFEQKPITFAVEIENTWATYGTRIDLHGRPRNRYTVHNTRVEFTSLYCF